MSDLIKNRILCNFIHFNDLEKAGKWYTEILGLKVRRNGIEYGYIEMELDGSDLTLLKAIDDIVRPSYAVFTFEADNVLQSRKDLIAKGVKVGEVQDFDEIIGCIFKDFEGNSLMVCGPKI